jgi:hypothetical protein
MYEDLIEEADKRLAALELIEHNQRWRREALPTPSNDQEVA